MKACENMRKVGEREGTKMSSISLFLLRLTATYILMCSGIKFPDPDKIQMNIFIMSGKNS